MTGEEFKQRFMPYSGRMYAVALSLTCDGQEAEDAVQDAYLRLWTRRDSLPRMDNAEAYCVTLVKHVCYDRLRSRRLTPDGNGIETMRKAAQTDTAEEVEAKDHAAIMRRCIARLPETARLLVVMRDVNGLGYDEIAQATGLAPSNIRVTLSRARKTLREQFNAIINYGNKRN